LKDGSARFSAMPIKENDTVTFKDLGPQISWRTVFMVEYFGPILMHALCYFLPQVFYSQPAKEKHLIQHVAFALVVLHYAKREYESVFVHHFSNATMPAFNIIKNSTHYWLLGGLFISYYLYHPLYTAPTNNRNLIYAAAAIFVLAELGNLKAHMTLRDLRPAGTKDRGIPRGGLFEYVTCANYTYELLAWLVFAIFTQVLTAWLFFVVSFGQIAIWALKKHVALKKEFGASGKLPKRKILVPFIW
jgi:very-long-chain enoyl-CoA reductase